MSAPVFVDGFTGLVPRRRVLLGGAAVVSILLFQVNLPRWDRIVFDVAGLDEQTRLGAAIHFFLYDTTKIALLLTGVIFVVTVLRSFMPVERTRALLSG